MENRAFTILQSPESFATPLCSVDSATHHPFPPISHERSALSSPHQVSAIGQARREDVRPASQILDDEIHRLGRLSLEEQPYPGILTQRHAYSWPLPVPQGRNEMNLRPLATAANEASRRSLSPPCAPTAPHTSRAAVKDALYAWPFCPDWSLDVNSQAAAKEPRAAVYADTGAAFRKSPALDSSLGSDTESSGPSTYDRGASMSPVNKQPGDFPALPDPRCLAGLGFPEYTMSSQGASTSQLLQNSFNPLGADFGTGHNLASLDATSRLLAACSHESFLINQMQDNQPWQYGQTYDSMRPTHVGGFLTSPVQNPHLRQWRNTSIPEGPSAKNRKQELYKTEMCRNWEEMGQCEYGR